MVAQERPQPSAEWEIRRNVDCSNCGTWWRYGFVRFLGGVWFVLCPVCDEQRWHARQIR